jgi:ATP-binding cassette subfamily B protein
MTLRTSRRLFGIVWHENKRASIESVISVSIPGLVPFISAYLYAQIINFIIRDVAGHHQPYGHLYLLIALRIILLFIQDLAITAQRHSDIVINTLLPLVFSQQIMNQLAVIDVGMLEDSDFQNRFQSIKENSTWRPRSMYIDLIYSLQNIIQLMVAAASLLFLNWIFAIVIVLTAIPTFIYQSRTAHSVWSIWDTNSTYRKRYSYIYYNLQDVRSIKEFKVFRLGPYFAAQATALGKKFANENMKAINNELVLGICANFVNVLGYGLVEIYIFLRTIGKHLSIGSLTYYTTVLLNFQAGTNGLFANVSQLFDNTQYIAELFDVLDIKPTIVSPSDAIKLPANVAPTIEFSHVSYSYPQNDHKVLDDFSLVIKPGEKIAFVGENGAGKTTLIKLLCRFYDVDEGQILISGIDIKQLDLVSWYDHIGVLFQDFLKYSYSLRDNIWFGKVTSPAVPEQIIAAAQQSGADAVKDTLKHGYKQMLGPTFEDGLDLSTGQWQKVALARGFYRNAPILVLDEPTAAIDAKAEHEIFQKVEQLTADKTAIIISHRFSTVRNADTIYVIKDGKISESGSHQELMRINGTYAGLFNLQAEAYR